MKFIQFKNEHGEKEVTRDTYNSVYCRGQNEHLVPKQKSLRRRISSN